jgi:hypothetical protein
MGNGFAMNNPIPMTTIEHIRRPNDATGPQPDLSENSDQSSRQPCKVANLQRTTSTALKMLALSYALQTTKENAVSGLQA